MEEHYSNIEVQDAEEYRVLSSVLSAHCSYDKWATETILTPKKNKYDSLTEEEKGLLNWFPDYLSQLQISVEINSKYLNAVVDTMNLNWGGGKKENWFRATELDLDKVRGLMAQYTREWSTDGVKERSESFGRILDTAERLFPEIGKRPGLNVLVPGAGLGRLVVEFVKRGFSTQGNEISYHMLLNCNYLLSNTFCKNNFVICPYIHKSSNVEKRNYQCRQVYFPDYNPGDISLLNKDYPEIDVQELMSMVSGGFVDLYGPPNLASVSDIYSADPTAVDFRNSNRGKFNIVATCFFIDTATNIIDYLKTIKHCLNDNGYWINFGPLLWHFENDDSTLDVRILDHDEGNVKKSVPLQGLELSKDDLIKLISKVGFEFIEHTSNIESSYGGDPRGLGNWNYKCEYWVCKKKI